MFINYGSFFVGVALLTFHSCVKVFSILDNDMLVVGCVEQVFTKESFEKMLTILFCCLPLEIISMVCMILKSYCCLVSFN